MELDAFGGRSLGHHRAIIAGAASVKEEAGLGPAFHPGSASGFDQIAHRVPGLAGVLRPPEAFDGELMTLPELCRGLGDADRRVDLRDVAGPAALDLDG